MEEELSRLKELREELKREFGKDLWEKSLEDNEEKELLKIYTFGIRNS